MSTFLMSNVSQTLINFQLCTEKEVFFFITVKNYLRTNDFIFAFKKKREKLVELNKIYLNVFIRKVSTRSIENFIVYLLLM